MVSMKPAGRIRACRRRWRRIASPYRFPERKESAISFLIVARDAAGNESRKEVSDFVITNNPLLRLISQKNFARNAAIATVAGLMGLSCVVNGPSLLQELKRRRLRGKIR